MKAAVLRNVNQMCLEDLPDPTAGEREVVVRVQVCGICATDINMWRGTNDEGTFPFVPGHEWSGEIVEVGPKVGDFVTGDRVVGECSMACQTCRNCRDGLPPEACLNCKLFGFGPDAPGAMAEYHKSPVKRLYKIPENVSYEEASLVEPISVAYNGIWGVAGGVKPHDRVVVIGCGPIGMFAVLICKAAGVPVIAIEPHPDRRQMAKQYGAQATVDPTAGKLVEEVMDQTGGQGASLIIECSGSDKGRASALDIVTRAGRIVLIGLGPNETVPMDMNKAVFQAVHIIGNDGSAHYFASPLELMSRQLVDFAQVITHRFPLDGIQDALELGAQQAMSSKITLVM